MVDIDITYVSCHSRVEESQVAYGNSHEIYTRR